MALTYEESAQLMQDPTFRGRVKVAALTYAEYLTNQPGNSNAKARWIQTCFASPDQMAMTLTPPTVMDPAVQQDGAAVTDAALQAAVQAVADVMM